MTDNIYTDAAQHDAVIAARAKERLAQIMPDTTQKADERFMAWRQLAQAEKEIERLNDENRRLMLLVDAADEVAARAIAGQIPRHVMIDQLIMQLKWYADWKEGQG